MVDETHPTAATSPDRVHDVRLIGEVGGGVRGTIVGPLPLWFVHQGVAYVRAARRTDGSDGTSIHEYRAVTPA
ncbi:hypothetical protein [Amnibacterium sp.]|uniref:hypothetical protein n=1 Tax=Amnibacterium sp. TaxID=1872496 RepID=UPI002619EE59|nr:hypothetical protein [Amnibacterium sp.]MCU1473002.1 hypothetical protein [Amnibacterium sp.]